MTQTPDEFAAALLKRMGENCKDYWAGEFKQSSMRGMVMDRPTGQRTDALRGRSAINA